MVRQDNPRPEYISNRDLGNSWKAGRRTPKAESAQQQKGSSSTKRTATEGNSNKKLKIQKVVGRECHENYQHPPQLQTVKRSATVPPARPSHPWQKAGLQDYYQSGSNLVRSYNKNWSGSHSQGVRAVKEVESAGADLLWQRWCGHWIRAHNPTCWVIHGYYYHPKRQQNIMEVEAQQNWIGKIHVALKLTILLERLKFYGSKSSQSTDAFHGHRDSHSRNSGRSTRSEH